MARELASGLAGDLACRKAEAIGRQTGTARDYSEGQETNES